MKKTSTWYFLLIVFFVWGGQACRKHETYIVDGWRPIYAPKADLQNITTEPPRSLGKLGKIFIMDSLLFVNELWRGIHVFNNADPRNPRPLVFIRVAGCLDMAGTGNYLYVDNFTDLVTIDISRLPDIQVVSRIADLYPTSVYFYPPFAEEYFECVDTTKGFPLDWEFVKLENPRCSRGDTDSLNIF